MLTSQAKMGIEIMQPTGRGPPFQRSFQLQQNSNLSKLFGKNQPPYYRILHQSLQSLSIQNTIQTPQNMTISRSDSTFPDLTATECRGARRTCGRVSGLGFFHDNFRYGSDSNIGVTKRLQGWSYFDMFSIDRSM